MFKKLLALSLVSVLAVGVAAARIPPQTSIPIDFDPDCGSLCAPAVTLPGGTVCVLGGCVDNGSSTFCLYSCF